MSPMDDAQSDADKTECQLKLLPGIYKVMGGQLNPRSSAEYTGQFIRLNNKQCPYCINKLHMSNSSTCSALSQKHQDLPEHPGHKMVHVSLQHFHSSKQLLTYNQNAIQVRRQSSVEKPRTNLLLNG